jgi:hypothetical protein
MHDGRCQIEDCPEAGSGYYNGLELCGYCASEVSPADKARRFFESYANEKQQKREAARVAAEAPEAGDLITTADDSGIEFTHIVTDAEAEARTTHYSPDNKVTYCGRYAYRNVTTTDKAETDCPACLKGIAFYQAEAEAEAPTHMRRELSVSGSPEAIREAVADWTAATADSDTGATVTLTDGYWIGDREIGSVIRFDWPTTDEAAVSLWDSLVSAVAVALPLEAFGHATEFPISFREIDLAAVREAAAEKLIRAYAASRYGIGLPASANADSLNSFTETVDPRL